MKVPSPNVPLPDVPLPDVVPLPNDPLPEKTKENQETVDVVQCHSTISTVAEDVVGDEIAANDWVVVIFHMEEGAKKSRKFIGRVTEIESDNTFVINFLKVKVTKRDSGLIYEYPKIPYIENVTREQIVQKLLPPKIVLRGAYLFDMMLN